MKKIAMIGCGKLGQDCAEVMAEQYDVIGYDVEHRTPSNFKMADSIQEAIKNRDLIFIAAPTPHESIYGGETPTSHLPNKDFDYTIVKQILTNINQYANKNQLVVLISTVLPGTVRSQLIQCISNARFIYNPYLIAMGTIKWDMVNPEMVIIGTDDGSVTGDAQELIDFYKPLMENNPRYEIGTWDEAESIKIFYNTFISTKLSLVNMIQDVAETNGNINVDVVTSALSKSNYRITGPQYMTAGMGDGGACHPRDNIALRWLADKLDLGYDLFDAIMRAREVQAERQARRCLANGKNVTIVGKAYKPAVDYTNGSASLLVGHYIEQLGGNVNYYDPHTGDNDLREEWTHVYFIGYWDTYTEKLNFPIEATVIDPWRKLTTKNHTGEIIHYGDTRLKDRYDNDPNSRENLHRQMYTMWPELKQYEDKIHLVYSEIRRDITFVLRPVEDIVAELKEAKLRGKSKFVFLNLSEAFMPHIVAKIQRITEVLDGIIDPGDIFHATSSIEGPAAYVKLADKRNWTKRINIIACHYFEYTTKQYSYEVQNLNEYEVKLKNKKMVCFNKINRDHRVKLLEKMLGNGILAQSYYSFEGDGNIQNFIQQLNDTEYPEIKKNQYIFPLRLNITPDRHNPVDIVEGDLLYHEDSYFSLVTESLFYETYTGRYHPMIAEPALFLTEKTYRPISLKHPFIIMARPGALSALRNCGYQTFSPFIDETYDTIVDDDRRFCAIITEVERLSSFTNEQWIEWQSNVKSIIEYNKKHFHARSDYRITADIEHLFNN